MTTKRTIIASALSVFTAVPLMAQTSVERKANYRPDGRAFVCVNGVNRYTRALYGSYADYRIETSDRPIFALYKKKDNKNIRFRISYEGQKMQLDSADYCEARYEAGRRDYIIKDKRWGRGELRLSVLAYHDSEGGVWRFTATGFKSPVSITGLICESATQKFHRFGDLGTIEKSGGFDAPAHPQQLNMVDGGIIANKPTYFSLDGTVLSVGGKAVADKFEQADRVRKELASMVTFDTPDPYINTIGGTMVMAADGAWDGRSWLHGAVGWRMPLNGWRAAYMGDFLGMPDRQRRHFSAYAKSQVTNVPVTLPHLMDEKHGLSRGAYKWGTPMYSNGYICRNPERNDQFHHYDMNLVYIDELLWHFSFDADTAYMREMWPVIKSHLEWEKRTWDPDNDGLYDAYCCIWASDALQYNSGAVTHSSAYNYRGNLLAARIAEMIGEDPRPYREEADRISKAMNARLWLSDEGHWAEFQDFMGLKRLHKDAAVWSVYTPVDCGPCTPEQAYRATRYVDSRIPYIPFTFDGKQYATISTTDWAPYEWSLNNVAMAEVMHTTLAYYKAGRPNAAYKLLKSNVLDFMYLGSSPGNFGQISKLDRNIGEAYRDFSDVTGISSRTFIEGLYGITPDALNGRCVIRPGFPSDWDSASVKTPYLSYSFRKVGDKEHYVIRQNIKRPLQIVIRQNLGNGRYKDTYLTNEKQQEVTLVSTGYVEEPEALPLKDAKATGTAFDDVNGKKCKTVDISGIFNSNVTDIFKNKYLAPRSPYTTLALPTQGIGDWCSTKRTANIDDSGIRSKAIDGVFTAAGVPFSTPQTGKNIVYTSLWDNYPDSVTIPLKGRGTHVYLLMTGSTNTMQSHFENGVVSVEYADGTSERLQLTNPYNWCPIEQDYDDDGLAFSLPHPRPYRVGLKTGRVSRTLAIDLGVKRVGKIFDNPGSKVPAMNIDGGAAQLLDIRINAKKKLKSLKLRTTANDVVIGLMGVTVQK